jgi:hypothetical protein
VTWNAYYQDDPWALTYYADMKKPANLKNVHPMHAFADDVLHRKPESRGLAEYTYLQPRMLCE